MAIMDCDTGGRLHPAIRRKNPRSRNKRADRYHTSSEKVELWTDAMKAEKHDSQKPCLQEEGRQHLECDQWTNGWSGHLREASKPETELKGEHDSRDNTNPEAHGKNAEPKLIDLEIYRLLSLQPKGLDHGQEGSKADRHRRKNDVKAHRKGKLNSGDNRRIEFHDSAPWAGNATQTTTAPSTNTASPAIASLKPNTPKMAKKKKTPTSAAAMDSTRCNGLPFRMESCDYHSVSSLVRPYDRRFCTSHASAPLLGNARALFAAPHGGGGYPALLSAFPISPGCGPQPPGCIRGTLAIRRRPARPPPLVLHRARVS